MFARKVTLRLKADAAGTFLQKMEEEIIPLLRKQQGFLDELTLLSHGGKEIYAYSFWESSEDAERYERSAFQEVTGLLNGLVEGPVRVHSYMVANSTFHKIAAAAAS
jgi:heme-degrading monooxygenase HmoA